MVANYHIGLLDVQMLRAPHLHLDAIEALEGQDRSTQEPRQRNTRGEQIDTERGCLFFSSPSQSLREQGARWARLDLVYMSKQCVPRWICVQSQ